jgi:hypothetical protein
MYKASYTVYADEVIYDGSYDPNETICKIEWKIADLLDMMAHHGVELTDENIERILGNRFERTLKERSIEEGWEIIDVIVDDAMYE